MKKTFSVKSLLVSMAIASSAALSVAPATTQAGVTGNMGAVSTYVFRGLKQTGAAAQGGLDYESDSGFILVLGHLMLTKVTKVKMVWKSMPTAVGVEASAVLI